MLPVLNQEKIIEVLRAYAARGIEVTPSREQDRKSDTVMSWATSSAPQKLLTIQEVGLIKRICGSVEGLERMTRGSDGQEELIAHIGPNTARAVCEFWENEWVA